MMLEMAFVMFLGLLIFGPRKTLEMSQSVGRSVAHFKRTASQMQAQMQMEVRALQGNDEKRARSGSSFERGDKPAISN